MQQTYFSNLTSGRIKDRVINSPEDKLWIEFKGDFLTTKQANHYFKILNKYTNFVTPIVTLKVKNPNTGKFEDKVFEGKRSQIAYGEKGVYYEFSGTKHYAEDWSLDKKDKIMVNKNEEKVLDIIHRIKKKVDKYCNTSFNYVLINRYKDGEDKLGFHKDNEYLFGDKPLIVGVSLGAERDIQLKPDENIMPIINKKLIPKTPITQKLNHGSLFLIKGETNNHWKHAIPPRARIDTPRISLTFRVISKD